MAGAHYSAFVEEAFIKPIRSVLIVDDDYPTFDEMLDAQIERGRGTEPGQQKGWHKDPARIKRVIGSFRTPHHPLLVDVHDGTNVSVGAEVKIASHLHQSDLLVLDYQLDRTRPGDGSTAISIVRSLMSNHHFNLVVIHTSEELEVVFRETLLALMSAALPPLNEKEREQVEGLLFEAENDKEGVTVLLDGSVGTDQYLHARCHPTTYLRAMGKSHQPYAKFRVESDAFAWDTDGRKLVLRYLLLKREAALRTQFNPKETSSLTWNEGAIKYIAADSVFVAFSLKADDDDLLAELLEALNAWAPEPSRLFLAKLRAEMDEFGVIAQRDVLESRHALAHWYRRLLESEGAARRGLVAESINRHSEQLMGGLLPRVVDFASRLIEAEAGNGAAIELTKQHFKVDLSKSDEQHKSHREHNAFVSSKPPEGWHLTTGHIFKVDDDYWVCVSPACDTVPAQLSAARVTDFGERLPFMAVKLTMVADGKQIKDVQTNRYVFIKLDGEVKAFCFNDPGNDLSGPAWHTLFADKRGHFDRTFTFNVFVANKGSRGMVQRRHSARVVAQLRYEYALNLVQRLGGTLTRIGLDYM